MPPSCWYIFNRRIFFSGHSSSRIKGIEENLKTIDKSGHIKAIQKQWKDLTWLLCFSIDYSHEIWHNFISSVRNSLQRQPFIRMLWLIYDGNNRRFVFSVYKYFGLEFFWSGRNELIDTHTDKQMEKFLLSKAMKSFLCSMSLVCCTLSSPSTRRRCL